MCPAVQQRERRRLSSLALASRHARDASRIDRFGRKALHRYVGGVTGVQPEHLRRVIEADPEAAQEADRDGYYALHYYCRGLTGELLEASLTNDSVERGLGTVEQYCAPQRVKSFCIASSAEIHFADAQCLADVRAEYKRKLLVLHPDKNIGREEEATERMQQLQDAYQEACRKFREAHPLETACKTGDAANVLVAMSETTDFMDADGNTLLHILCKHCTRRIDPEQLEQIIHVVGPKVICEQNSDGDTPLNVLFAHYRWPEQLAALLRVFLSSGGRSVVESLTRTNFEGRGPLHVACRYQRFLGQLRDESLSLILRLAPDAAKTKDAYDWTPLHLFSQFQVDPRPEAVKSLIAACPEAASARTCVDEDAPAHLACYAMRRKVCSVRAVEALRALAQAAPAAAVSSCRENKRPWNYLPRQDQLYPACCAALLEPALVGLDDDALLTFRDSKGGTMLHVVAGREGEALSYEACARLTSLCLLDATDDDDRTPLDRLCLSPGNDERHALARLDALLLPSLVEESRCDSRGWTAAHRAAAMVCEQQAASVVLARLLEVNPRLATVATRDDAITYAAHIVCASCHRSIALSVPATLARLASAAPDVAHHKDARGKYAWDYLPRNDDLFDECLRILIGGLVDRIDSVAEEDSDHESLVLHLVCAYHRESVVRVLTARPRQARLVDAAGNTALHCFAQHQELSVADKADLDALTALLKANEDAVLVANRFGLTPAHLLCAHQKPGPMLEVLALFLAARPHVAAARSDSGDTPLSMLCRANANTVCSNAPNNIKALLDAAASANDASDILAPCSLGLRPWDHLPVADLRYADCCDLMLGNLLQPAELASSHPLDRDGSTALHILFSQAGTHCRRRTLSSIREFAVSFEVRNNIGATPAHYAAQFLDVHDALDLEALLTLIEASPSSVFLAQTSSGWTPLLHFVYRFAEWLSLNEEPGDGAWLALRALIAKAPQAVGVASSAGDTPLHAAAHVNKSAIGPHAAALFNALASADPRQAALAARKRGKTQRLPVEWLPISDPRFDECDEILTHRAARCLELLLEHGPVAASIPTPHTGELALHQLCGLCPPLLTLLMLDQILRANSKAVSTQRATDMANPLHILCRALATGVVSSAKLNVGPDLLRAILHVDPAAARQFDAYHKRPLDYLGNEPRLAACRAVFQSANEQPPRLLAIPLLLSCTPARPDDALTPCAWRPLSPDSPNSPPPGFPKAASDHSVVVSTTPSALHHSSRTVNNFVWALLDGLLSRSGDHTIHRRHRTRHYRRAARRTMRPS